MTTASGKRVLIGAISPAAGGPLYRQIIDGVKREVSEGRLRPGEEMPSFRALAEQLMVSMITVKRAYEELERDGVIYRRQGLGTFVADRADDRSREMNLEAARRQFEAGIRQARQAGLGEAEILEMARTMMKEGTH